MPIIGKRPEVPTDFRRDVDEMVRALIQYVEEDRAWLLDLARKQRAFMEHEPTCPKRRHPRDPTCTCGLSELLSDPLR